MKVRVGLVTDSSGDVPSEWLARLNVPVIPAFINIGEESYPDDGIALPHDEFYRRLALAKPLPTTSAPPPGLAQEILRRALDEAEHVVAITVAAPFSSIHNTVRLAAQQVDPERITVYDSGAVSMGLGWQVVIAAEAAQRGASLTEVLEAVRHARQRIEVWAMIDNLEYLRRSGRVSALVASVGSLLRIKPIIRLKESNVTSIQRVRTRRRAIQSLVTLTRGSVPLERLAVLHSHDPEGAEVLRAQLADIAPSDTPVIDINTALGTHFGPGGLGVALIRGEV
jgi:DegV family protein with EDD domain